MELGDEFLEKWSHLEWMTRELELEWDVYLELFEQLPTTLKTTIDHGPLLCQQLHFLLPHCVLSRDGTRLGDSIAIF